MIVFKIIILPKFLSSFKILDLKNKNHFHLTKIILKKIIMYYYFFMPLYLFIIYDLFHLNGFLQ